MYFFLTSLCSIQYNISMMDEKQKNALKNLKQELRRGAIALVAMSRLQEAHYGYAMIRDLKEQGFDVGQDTLYPLLRRLETQGLLESEWRVEDPRPRRYYQLSQSGKEAFQELLSEWKEQDTTIRRIINESK